MKQHNSMSGSDQSSDQELAMDDADCLLSVEAWADD